MGLCAFMQFRLASRIFWRGDGDVRRMGGSGVHMADGWGMDEEVGRGSWKGKEKVL